MTKRLCIVCELLALLNFDVFIELKQNNLSTHFFSIWHGPSTAFWLFLLFLSKLNNK